MDLGQAVERWVNAHAGQLSSSLRRDVSAIATSLAWLGHNRRPAAPLDPTTRRAIAQEIAESQHSLEPGEIDEFLAIVSAWTSDQRRSQSPKGRRPARRVPPLKIAQRSAPNEADGDGRVNTVDNRDTDPHGIRPVVVSLPIAEELAAPEYVDRQLTDPKGIKPVVLNNQLAHLAEEPEAPTRASRDPVTVASFIATALLIALVIVLVWSWLR